MLFKNVLRTLKKQYVQLALLGIIIALSSFIYTTMDYAIGGIYSPTQEYFDEANQEDFAVVMHDNLTQSDILYLGLHTACSFDFDSTLGMLKETDSACYYAVINNRINSLETIYPDINIENREAKDLYFDFNNQTNRFRFLKDMADINITTFVAGTKPTEDYEIAVSETYAKINDLSIGDSITIQSKDYTLTGFVLFPDYSLAMFGSDLVFDNETQTLAFVIDSEFENINSITLSELAGDGLDLTSEDIQSEIIDDYTNHDQLDFIRDIVLTENNMRSGAIYGEIEGGQAMGLGLSMMIASIALFIVGIMISKVLHSQRGPLGILKSMGYKNTEIVFPYILFIMILSFPAIILGYFLGLLAAEPMKNMYLLFYLLPSNPIVQTPMTFFIAVLVPFTFIVVLSYLIIKRMLRQKPVVLLNPEVTTGSSKIAEKVSKVFKRRNIVSKLKQLLLFRNIVKFFVFIIGMFYAAFLIFLSLSMVGLMDRMVTQYYERTDFEYMGVCNPIAGCPVTTGNEEMVIMYPGAKLDDIDVDLFGLDADNDLHRLYSMKDKDITSDLEEGIIITRSLELMENVSIGDTYTLSVGAEEQTFKVVGVTEEYSGSKAYILRSELSTMLTGTTTYYNMVYSDQVLNQADYMSVIKTDDIVNQMMKMQSMMDTMVYILIGVSIIIGAIIVYILTVMTVEDNFYNISLFKVIGYNNKEIDKMILGGYFGYGVAIFIIVMPVSYFAFQIMTKIFADYYDLLMPFEFKLWHGVLGLLIYVIIFYIGGFSAKRKLDKISLQEAMKMYQI